MLRMRITIPSTRTDEVIALLADNPAVSAIAVDRGSSVKPPGDVVAADVAREAANDVIDRLMALDVHRSGSVTIDSPGVWLSDAAYHAEQVAPGSSADAVVWADVTLRAYEDSELNWTYFSFMTMATLLASIAIIVDSQVLVIGAMVLGPEFGPIAALGLALVRRRWALFGRALRTLSFGFVVAIVATMLAAVVARAAGWIDVTDLTRPRPDTAFIYQPDRWSFVVALIAAAAGVLSLTSSKLGGLSGVFISVTTVPAAGNVALGLAFGVPGEIRGSAVQLALNISGMIVAGWLTLLVQQVVWSRVTVPPSRMAPPAHHPHD